MTSVSKTLDAVPLELREVPQWVVWRYENRNSKKPTKVPYRADGAGKASSTAPSTWSTYEDALGASAGFDGIGFVLSKDDPFAGVDFDNCIGNSGELDPNVRAWVEKFASYTEVSPSGKGIRVFVLGDVDKGIVENGTEVYSQGRFLTVTGNAVEGFTNSVVPAQEALDALVSSLRSAHTTETGRVRIADLTPDMRFTTRNPQLQGWLGELRREGLTYTAAINELDRLNKAHCEPPYTKTELKQSFTRGSYEAWDGDEEHDEGWGTLRHVDVRAARYAYRPILQEGAFHLLTGAKNAGKGTITTWLAAMVTRGELGPNRKVIWVSAGEDSLAIDVKPRMLAANGVPDLVEVPLVRLRLPRDIEKIKARASRIGGVGLIVLDPLSGMLERGSNTNSDGDVRYALDELNGLADELGCLVIGVRHLKKDTSQGALEGVMGSGDWINIPRMVIGVAVDNEDPDVRHVKVVTGNRGNDADAGLQFRFEGVDVVPGGIPVGRAVLLGDSNKDLDALLASKGASKTRKAKIRILDILDAETEIESDALDARVANEVGLSARTVRDARMALANAGLLRPVPEKNEDGKVLKWKVQRSLASRPAELRPESINPDETFTPRGVAAQEGGSHSHETGLDSDGDRHVSGGGVHSHETALAPDRYKDVSGVLKDDSGGSRAEPESSRGVLTSVRAKGGSLERTTPAPGGLSNLIASLKERP